MTGNSSVNENDVDEYYREMDAQTPWHPRNRRTVPMRPGMAGYRPMTVFSVVFMVCIGIFLVWFGLTSKSGTASLDLCLGVFLVIGAVLLPFWAIKQDNAVKAEVARRKRSAQQNWQGPSPPMYNVPDQPREPVRSYQAPRPMEAKKARPDKNEDEIELVETRTATDEDEIENERI